MKKEFAMAVLLLALGTAGNLAAANPQGKMAEKPTFAGVLNGYLSHVEQEMVPAAEAMPEAKYNFAPTQGEFKGVRTYAQQVKHMAAANYMFGAAILQEKPPVALSGENGPDSLTSKAQIVKFLQDSFAYLHKAMSSVNENNILEEVPSPFGNNKMPRLALINIALSHPFDHYGQMVEYLRMNGIVPPASRKH